MELFSLARQVIGIKLAIFTKLRAKSCNKANMLIR